MSLDARFIQRPKVGGWADQAACHGSDLNLFYAPSGGRAALAAERRAKALCETCPSRLDCLTHALDHDEQHGVWGGLGPDERRDVRRARRVTCTICDRAFLATGPGRRSLCSDECRAQSHRDAKRRYKERTSA